MGDSITDDFNGFKVMVGSRDSFPLMDKNLMMVEPGYETFVTISAKQIQSDRKIAMLDPKKRLCYFREDRNVKLHAHKNYTQENCLFECMLEEAQIDKNLKCLPWYFPPVRQNQTTCDPFQAETFEPKYSKECDRCLPDCEGTYYSVRSTHARFRRCDYRNMNGTRLCAFRDDMEPKKYHDKMKEEYARNDISEIPAYATAAARKSNIRKLRIDALNIFPAVNSDYKYNAYEKDIAVAHFYFSDSTLVQYQRSLKYSYLDLFAQVGGLLGLFIGISLCSIIEIVYWFVYKLVTYATCKKRNESSSLNSAPDHEQECA